VTGVMIDDDPFGRYHKMPFQFNESKNIKETISRSIGKQKERHWH